MELYLRYQEGRYRTNQDFAQSSSAPLPPNFIFLYNKDRKHLMAPRIYSGPRSSKNRLGAP